MNPLSILGKHLKEVHSQLGMFILSEVFDDLEEGEKQEYSVASTDNKWEISLNSENVISTIFLYLNNGYSGFENITSDMSKNEVVSLFGEPNSSGAPRNDTNLGKYGAWEKYLRKDHYLHIEHEDGYEGVKMVTLMVLDD